MTGVREDGSLAACVCNSEQTCCYHQDRPYLIGVRPLADVSTEVRHGNVCVLKDGELIKSYNRFSDDGADMNANSHAYNLRVADRKRFNAEVRDNRLGS